MRKLALLLSLLLILSALSACATAPKPTDGTAEGSAEQTTEKPVEEATEKLAEETTEKLIESPVSDFVYQKKDNVNGIWITKYVGNDETVVIPAEIEGLPVSEICGYTNDAGKTSGAFQGTEIRSVVIPNTVRFIFQRAFSDCKNLEQVSFGSGSELSTISMAFENCVSLKKIDLSATKLTRIGSCSFYGCTNLKECKLCDTITYIGERAFYNCTSLQEIRLPNQLETLENEAFYKCSSLQRLTIPKTLSVVKGSSHFMDCTSLNDVQFEEGMKLCMWGYSFFGNCSSLTELTIPASMERLDASLFILPNLSKIVFLGNCPQLGTLNYSEFKSGTTIYYDPRTEGWDPWPWSDPCTHASLVS